MHRVVTNYTPVEGSGSNISVYVRARPVEDGGDANEVLQIDPDDDRKLSIKDPEASNRRYGEVSFQFDKIFWCEAEQNAIFDRACKENINHVLNGYNSCIFAYGQTGSGKVS
jgi:kinesin family member C2/C3